MSAPPQKPTPTSRPASNGEGVEPLRHGERLDRDEFERRYHAMPEVNKAELIEGVVFMPSPVYLDTHGRQHGRVMMWLGAYLGRTPGIEMGDNTTVRLDTDNEYQPDAFLIILPERGGRTTRTGRHVTGGPELAGEVAASSVSIDRGIKMNAYRRNGVQEYFLWRTEDAEIDWFVLRGDRYEALPAGPDGIHRSEIFPGLWLDVQALLADDLGRVLDVVQEGIASPEHAAFVAHLNPPTA